MHFLFSFSRHLWTAFKRLHIWCLKWLIWKLILLILRTMLQNQNKIKQKLARSNQPSFSLACHGILILFLPLNRIFFSVEIVALAKTFLYFCIPKFSAKCLIFLCYFHSWFFLIFPNIFFLQPLSLSFNRWFPFHNNFHPSRFRIHSFAMPVPCPLFFAHNINDASMYVHKFTHLYVFLFVFFSARKKIYFRMGEHFYIIISLPNFSTFSKSIK